MDTLHPFKKLTFFVLGRISSQERGLVQNLFSSCLETTKLYVTANDTGLLLVLGELLRD